MEIKGEIGRRCQKIDGHFINHQLQTIITENDIATAYVSDRAGQDKVVNCLFRCIAVWTPWVLPCSPSMECLGRLGLLCS